MNLVIVCEGPKRKIFTLAGPRAVVWDEASATGVRLSRAHLTGVTPRPAHCGTAQRLCAHDPRELALTHLVVDRGEARSSAVVCNGKKAALSSGGNSIITNRNRKSLLIVIYTQKVGKGKALLWEVIWATVDEVQNQNSAGKT